MALISRQVDEHEVIMKPIDSIIAVLDLGETAFADWLAVDS